MGKKSTEKDRMKRLIKSFEEKNVILKEDNSKIIDENFILKESKRLKEIARIDEWITNPKLNKTTSYSGVHGTTVNTFLPNTEEQIVKTYNPNYTYLQSNEALSLAIKRTIESGSPINKLGFYEEVNWQLNNMGFNSRQPIDIKASLKNLIKF